MIKTDNIYIDSLRFGSLHMQTGLSYQDLTNHLAKIGWKIDEGFSEYFQVWFLTNFYERTMYAYFKYGNPEQVQSILRNLKNHSTEKCRITAAAFDTLQDYDKLVQTKKDSAKAMETALQSNYYARWAMYIAISLGLLQIILQIIALFTANSNDKI
jgi:hypothetical protein